MSVDLNHKSGFQYRVNSPGVAAMGQITPSDTQKRAIDQIKHWFQNESENQQVFRLFGYAGTGKSTVLKFALQELGLEPHRGEDDEGGFKPGVVTATFTGKAALVLRRKGTPARTIHSLIYKVVERTEQEIEEARKKIEEMESAARGLTGYDAVEAEARIQFHRQELAKMKRPSFVRNEQTDASEAALIVLDEVSMVGEEMAHDLLSFKKPILVLGDPGQLPPIKGEGAFTKCQPDVMLTEIHRQAEESAIIRLATMARNGEFIPYGQYDAHVAKLRKGDVSPSQMLRGGQLICGMNATRFQLNNDMRYAAGLADGFLPTGPNEKIICLKNQNDIGLINGMFLTLENIAGETEHFFSAAIRDDEGNYIGGVGVDDEPERHRIYKGHFLDHVEQDKDRHDRDWKIKRGLIEATFGWAITCHKAQGSQWENIIVWDDGLGRTEADRRCWLYTAITRAERGLVLLA
jgi:exodeoxyribonuclease-5